MYRDSCSIRGAKFRRITCFTALIHKIVNAWYRQSTLKHEVMGIYFRSTKTNAQMMLGCTTCRSCSEAYAPKNAHTRAHTHTHAQCMHACLLTRLHTSMHNFSLACTRTRTLARSHSHTDTLMPKVTPPINRCDGVATTAHVCARLCISGSTVGRYCPIV